MPWLLLFTMHHADVTYDPAFTVALEKDIRSSCKCGCDEFTMSGTNSGLDASTGLLVKNAKWENPKDSDVIYAGYQELNSRR